MVSKTSIHAIRALAYLASLPAGAFVGAESLAKCIGAPPTYLAKLLQALARAGLVESRKGLGGGFRLARPASSIVLADILAPIDPPGALRSCFLGRENCSDDDPCAVHDQWAALRASFDEMVRTTTLASLVKEPCDRGTS